MLFIILLLPLLRKQKDTVNFLWARLRTMMAMMVGAADELLNDMTKFRNTY